MAEDREKLMMITAASLNAQKSKELAQLAKKRGVTGWHSMKKGDLVKALLKVARNEQRQSVAKKLNAQQPLNQSRPKRALPKPWPANQRSPYNCGGNANNKKTLKTWLWHLKSPI